MINDFAFWEDSRWFCELKWRRSSFSWEEELVKQLLTVIALVVVTHANNSWVYRFNGGGMFNVKSHYMYLYRKFLLLPSLGQVGHHRML
jgi:hypothetical protein